MGTRVGRRVRQSWRDEVAWQPIWDLVLSVLLLIVAAAILVYCVVGGVR